jgi:polysaccharide biosynthesis transport protein
MNEHAQLDLASLVAVLRRRRWLIVGIALGAAALAFAFSALQAERYEAEAKVLFRQAQAPPRVDPSEPPPDIADSPERVAATNLAFASLETVTARAKRRLHTTLSVDDLRENVRFEPAGQADIVKVIASGGTPAVARRRANVFANEIVKVRSERARAQVQRVIDAIRGQLAAVPSEGRLADQLTRRAEQLEVEKRLEGGDAEVAEMATTPTDPVAPRPVRNTIIGGLLGLLLGSVLAVVLRRFDRRVENETELSQLIGAPVMGRIPVEGEGWERELYQDSFHFLRTNLEAASEGRRHQVIAVTGAVPGVGKSSVAARLAEALALGGSHVVAVDCDLRKPKLHEHFGVSGEFGVADALAAGAGTMGLLHQTAENLLQETEEGVRVLAAGTFFPVANSVLKGAVPLGELVERMRLAADWVVLDTAPVTIGALTSTVATSADGVLLVVDLSDVDRDVLAAAADQLRSAGARIIGVVLNRAPVLLTDSAYRTYYEASGAAKSDNGNGSGRRRWLSRAGR